MTRLFLLALALGFCGACSGQTIYRCVDSSGKPVYQQHPCGAAGAKVDVAPGNVVTGDAAAGAAFKRDMAVRAAIERREIIAGMTDAELRQVLGDPAVVNTDTSKGSVRRQYVYRYPNGDARYVYTRNGVVEAVKERPAERPVPTQPCHSEQEMHNQRVAISASTISDRRRAALTEELKRMQECRR